MPLHGYSTDRRPPTNLDHMLAHPYAIAVAVWQIFAGSLVVTALVFGFGLNTSAMCLALHLPARRSDRNQGNGKCLGRYWLVAVAVPGFG